MNLILKAAILISVGLVFLRISGRKSISQMTISQTVIMISIGSLIVQPIANKSLSNTILSAAVFIGFIILIEYLQLKFDFIEALLSGKSKTVIEDGNILPENLKKMKITIDQLEMRLRQQGISKISDVKTATLEPNGQLGYELMRHAKPVTIGEMEQMLASLIIQHNQQQNVQEDFNLFTEVRQKSHAIETPKKFQ
ncbi:DUF421 domain-containing protein [Clostridiaceae bacterium 35-E11]